MASNSAKVLAKRVKELRAKCNWDQPKLAFEAGISVKTVSFIENGTTETKVNIVERVATALGVSVAEILTDSPESQPTPRVIQVTPFQALRQASEFFGRLEHLPLGVWEKLAQLDQVQGHVLDRLLARVLAKKQAKDTDGSAEG